MGEGALHPMRMLRQGRYKYVHVHDETPMLFDLETDPEERQSLAGQDGFQDVESELRAACLRDWDGAALDAAVRQSQRERFLIRNARHVGRHAAWDWQPRADAAEQYYRDFEDQRRPSE